MRVLKPFLLVDVDGVLNPYPRQPAAFPPGYTAFAIGVQQVWLWPAHGIWLHELAKWFELVWASTWEAETNSAIGARIGAPPGIPHLHFTHLDPQGWTWKLPAVQGYVADRPVAWLDDAPGWGAEAWAASRVAPTRLIRPDQHTGWTEEEFAELVDFGKRLRAGPGGDTRAVTPRH